MALENPLDNHFADIIQLIKQARANALRAVNTELINLYWSIGEYISKKIEQSEWGESVVTELASFIQTNEPEIKGFSDKNSCRMKQFYETYRDYPKLAPLVREISWTFQTAGKTVCYSKKESFRIKIKSYQNVSF